MTNNKHKPHRTPTWKRDTLLLTCLLRLRVQPSIPYPLIASTILSHFHDPVVRFYTRYAYPSPSDPEFNEEALLAWLANWLEEKYVHAEKWLEECFLQAVGKEERVVQKVLEVCGFVEEGFVVKEDQEWRAQVSWLRDGNWRVGSESLVVSEERGAGEYGAIEQPAAAPTSASDTKEEEKKRESVNTELLERLRNLEFEDDQSSIMAPQSMHIQQLLPATAPEQLPMGWGTTLNPRTPVFHPSQWTPDFTPILEEPATATIFYDPHTGQILDFEQAEGLQVVQQHFPQPEVHVDPKKASLAARLQFTWNGFSQQLDEIKVLEEMLIQKQAARKRVMGCESVESADWIGTYFSGN